MASPAEESRAKADLRRDIFAPGEYARGLPRHETNCTTKTLTWHPALTGHHPLAREEITDTKSSGVRGPKHFAVAPPASGPTAARASGKTKGHVAVDAGPQQSRHACVAFTCHARPVAGLTMRY